MRWLLLITATAALAPPAPSRASAVDACVACAKSGDLAGALTHLEAARGTARSAEAWEAVLVGVARSGSAALLRIYESFLHDGAGALSPEAAAALAGRVPPAVGGDDDAAAAIPAPALGPPPPLWVRPRKSVDEVECRGDGGAAAAASLAGARTARTPLILRGVGSDWPALAWDAATIAGAYPGGVVCRLSETRGVAFCRESHPRVLAGDFAPPSRAVVVPPAAAARRLRGEGAPPLVYAGGEHLYAQALAPPRLVRDIDLAFLGRSSLAAVPRVWACRAGIYSPLHYDAQDSVLISVVGGKRLLLWPPDALDALRPEPDDSPAARRCGVDVREGADLDGGIDRARIEASALEAVLGPGDALWFPSRWAHHTEATGPGGLSVALSLREVDGAVVGG